MDGSNLLPLLEHRLAAAMPERLCVAFSGGADSTALLHALAQLPQTRARGLRALHVDHALHRDSRRWAEHCRRFCDALGVAIEVVRVQVGRERNQGLEAAARHARHAAFASAIQPGEWLALAHHRDDQIETVVLKLLRGAGPHGLGGMRERRALGPGTLWRPLLDVPRSVLRAYVADRELDFIEDPSNSDTRLSRNYLRAEIVPRLLAHWPHAPGSIVRSAALCRAASGFIDEQTVAALARLRDARDGTLDARGWSALPDALRLLVLERWLHEQGLAAPPPSRCEELRRQVDQARGDREPCIAWPAGEVHVWRGALHAMPPLPHIPGEWEAEWNGTPLMLPGGTGELGLRNAGGGIAREPRFAPSLRVRFRRGGERIRPVGDAHTRELRDLFQRSGIPPWRRGRIPLVFRGDELLAVGDLWTSTEGVSYFDACGVRLEWWQG
ncbi:MAG TPA: tRNA lysidine(34) synthetase TilS [Rhodanobacteraceae bacterium]|nr:tRNA lysidine(34) synthetase TilS [Rhodanobacteraceae bacterium]